MLLREVQRRAAAEDVAVVLESTMEAVLFYERFGFRAERSLTMVLPRRGESKPTELYEERTMVWTPGKGE